MYVIVKCWELTLWRQYAVSGLTDCLTVLHHLEAVTHYVALNLKLDSLQAVMNAGSICLPDKSLCQCIRGFGPAYLADAFQPVARIPGQQRLQSSSTSALDIPSTWLYTVAEVTSNSLRTFKTKVKSHLFVPTFPYFPHCYRVCKASDVPWHFFHFKFNVM